MTSEEIRSTVTSQSTHHFISTSDSAFWLREIAYQLAVMNEHRLEEPIAIYTEGE